jgi:hypothetical protein
MLPRFRHTFYLCVVCFAELVWVTVIYSGIYIQFSTSKIQTVIDCSLKAENKALLDEDLYLWVPGT